MALRNQLEGIAEREEVVHISASIRARASRNFVQKEPSRGTLQRRAAKLLAAVLRLPSCCCREWLV